MNIKDLTHLISRFSIKAVVIRKVRNWHKTGLQIKGTEESP